MEMRRPDAISSPGDAPDNRVTSRTVATTDPIVDPTTPNPASGRTINVTVCTPNPPSGSSNTHNTPIPSASGTDTYVVTATASDRANHRSPNGVSTAVDVSAATNALLGP